VDRKKFEGIVRSLLDTRPVKREGVKIKNPKNREKLGPPRSRINHNPAFLLVAPSKARWGI